MNHIIKSILGWLAYFLILIGLIYGIPKAMSYALDTPYPMAAITSGSMWPALKTGDLVLIKGVKEKNDIKLGDIVVYKNPSKISGQVSGFTIHRVIQMNNETIITKGDANNIGDAPVKYADVIGKTVFFGANPLRVPILGNISIMVKDKKI